MKLNHVYRHLVQDFADNVRLLVHKQRDHRHKRRQHCRDFLRLCRRYRAFAFCVKHQPDGIRARFGGGKGILRAGDAADFGTDFHIPLSYSENKDYSGTARHDGNRLLEEIPL